LVSQSPTTTAAVTTTLGAPEESKSILPESKIAPKLRWKKAITKIQEQENFPPRLTVAAADFMFDNALTIRNSYTTQVMSQHYNIRHFPETHSAGSGEYGVPLWTVKLKRFPNPGQDPYNLCRPDNFAFAGVSEEAKQQHLDNFLDKIKSFLRARVPFGVGFEGYFDYELLVAKPRYSDYYLSDIGTYSTGGRTHGVYNAKTIVYRVTLNAYEIQLIKDILERKYDARISGIYEEKSSLNAIICNEDKINKLRSELYKINQVRKATYQPPILVPEPEDPAILDVITNTARYVICHCLCIEIIAAKLVLFLNAAGQSKRKVIALNAKQLDALLTRAVEIKTAEVQSVFRHMNIHCGSIHWLLLGCSPKKYLESKKYPPYDEKSIINKSQSPKP